MDTEIDILKKDLKGRNKKIEKLIVSDARHKAEAEHYKELWQIECGKNRSLYCKYIDAVSELALLKSGTEEGSI